MTGSWRNRAVIGRIHDQLTTPECIWGFAVSSFNVLAVEGSGPAGGWRARRSSDV